MVLIGVGIAMQIELRKLSSGEGATEVLPKDTSPPSGCSSPMSGRGEVVMNIDDADPIGEAPMAAAEAVKSGKGQGIETAQSLQSNRRRCEKAAKMELAKHALLP